MAVHNALRALPLILLLPLLIASASPCHATVENPCSSDQVIDYQINDVFDLNADNTAWFHHLANNLHIKTRQITLENEIAFLSPCETDEQKLYEVERFLRNRRFLRDARVQRIEKDEGSVIQVTTWDTWSLQPTIDFSRRGGQNRSALGIKDRNLLGLAIDADLAYFSNPELTGYRLDVEFPLYLGKNITNRIRLVDAEEGYQRSWILQRPFVQFNSEYAFQLWYNREDRVDLVFQNNDDEYRYRHDINFAQFAYGMKLNEGDDEALRVYVGYTQDENFFSEAQSEYLPADRVLRYPWVEVEWIQQQFVKLYNFRLIELTEDINLGWQTRFRLGRNLDDQTHQNAWVWQASVDKSTMVGDKTLLIAHADLYGFGDGDTQSGTSTGGAGVEIIQRFSDAWAWYSKVVWRFADNPLLDNPLTLGGESDLRGYPLQYQHGEQALLASVELRHYPRINWFQLIEVGGAMFFDAGRTYGNALLANNDAGWLQSIGIGARLFLPHSSEQQILHLDLVRPLSDQPGLNTVEFRMELKRAF